MSKEEAKIKVEFTNDEAVALINLLDAGVKSIGLQSAGPAAHIMNKMNEAKEALEQAEPGGKPKAA